MTLGPEQRLISEYKIPHVSLSCSSNWAAGRTPGNRSAEIDHLAVDSMASSLISRVIDCINNLIKSF